MQHNYLIYVVARLDGHGFTRLTKKEWNLEKLFDIRFRDLMISTTKHLMDCGFRIMYGYTQSDEISLLFHLDDDTFGRKERKLLSILASEASVSFSLAAGRPAIFDCRLIPLPNKELVVDYFRWRQEDSHRKFKQGYLESPIARRMKYYSRMASTIMICLLGKSEALDCSFVTKRSKVTIPRQKKLLFVYVVSYI